MIFILIYLASWLLVLGAYSIDISNYLYPDKGILISIIINNVIFMFVGFCFAKTFCFFVKKNYVTAPSHVGAAKEYTFDDDRISSFAKFLTIGVFVCVIGNIVTGGLPPIFRLFGLDVSYYLEYGKFSGPLQSFLAMLFLVSFKYKNKSNKYITRIFVLSIYAITVLRGPLLMVLLQSFFLWFFSVNFRQLKNVRNLFAAIFILLFVIIIFMSVFSTVRGELVVGILKYFRIKDDYMNWYPGIIIVIMYASIPSSNFLWIQNATVGGINGISAFNTLIPKIFRNPLRVDISDYSGTLDGVGTYMTSYYLGYGIQAIYILQFLLGIIAFVFSRKEMLDQRPLFAALFAEQLLLSTFFDTFTALVNVFEYVLFVMFYIYCLRSDSKRC
jgi:hypothetical protein